MREILFRGKRQEVGQFATTTNHEWVYGGFVKDCSGVYIHSIMYTHRMIKVDPATVGQYTGATDKNGVKIFEGDALIFEGGKETFEVWWSEGCCGFVAGHGQRTRPGLNPGTTKRCEVVGNVHDDPELSEVHDETV